MFWQRLAQQIPDWAHLSHPITRRVLGIEDLKKTRRKQMLTFAIVFIALVGSGVGIATTIMQMRRVYFAASELVFNAVFYPTLALQLMLSLGVMLYASALINGEKRKQTWDLLRSTASGTELMIRARWFAAILYQFAGVLGVIFVVRVALSVLLLYDLTAFSGDYLALISGGNVVPQLPLVAVIVIVAMGVTASFILPLTSLSMDAALGLLLSTFFTQRVFLVLVQCIWALVRVGGGVALVLLFAYTTDINTMPSTAAALGTSLLYGSFGDWGLLNLSLKMSADLWATVQYSILLGVGLLGMAFVQALAADLMMAWAIRRAEVRGI